MAQALQRSTTELPEGILNGLVEALARGEGPHEIAKRLHPNDRISRQRVRRKLQAAILHDQRMAEKIGQRARLELMVGLIPAAKGVSTRAGRGRMDAVRVLFEATGFHNPKVQHEHSGEVSIKLDMPRPKFEQDIVAEAEVVEE